MEQEFEEKATESLLECFDNPVGDLRQTDEFWNDRDNDSMHQLELLLQDSIKWCNRHKYEIENHFTSIDWLKVYSEAMNDHKLDMNVTLKMVKAERNGEAFPGSEGRSEGEW